MNNKELAHIWAQQNKESGKGSHMYFRGKSIFSYGEHFEIARFINSETVLFTTRSYSNSTAKHKNHVRSAITHKTVFTVPTFDNHKQNVEHYLNLITSTQAQTMRARLNQSFHVQTLEGYIDEAWDYARTFKKVNKALQVWKYKKDNNLLFTPEEIERMKLAQKAETERKRKQAEERKRKALVILEEWKRGDPVHIPYGVDVPTCLRIKDERIETSRGAQITIKTALRLWDALKNRQNVAGMALDNYTINSMDEKTLTVGCHQIQLTEIQRIATLLNV